MLALSSGLAAWRISLATSLSAAAIALSLLLALACGSVPEPTALSLIERFEPGLVRDVVTPDAPAATFEWRFDTAGADAAGLGWRALSGVEGLAVKDGRLAGTATRSPVLAVAAPEGLDASDQLYSLEIRQRVSAGEHLTVKFVADEKLDETALLDQIDEREIDLRKDLEPGNELKTYTLTAADTLFQPAFPLARIRHIVLMPTDAEGATFEIESMRLVPRKQHLASIASGVGWHGLGEIYRETVVARSPESIAFSVELPSSPRLDLAIGTLETGPVSFTVALTQGAETTTLLRRTVTTPDRWERASIDLEPWAGRTIELTLALASEEGHRIGFWGGPVVRNRAGSPESAPPSAARAALAPGRLDPPRGVILVLADTLRRDHLEPWGYERQNAPSLERLAGEGALFEDAIAQGTWTKVAATSILTSLYPPTHGLRDLSDRLSAAVTTAAESFRRAGYATFATSSVPFTGKLSNLHQGVEELHEVTSIAGGGGIVSKTARSFVDRLLPWLDQHRDMPFFVFLHVFDPHSPFEPQAPWNAVWMDPDAMAAHRKDMARVMEEIEFSFFKAQALPTRAEIDRAGVDPVTYVDREKAWYDASIRAMDVELARVVERLEELGLRDDTLLVFVSDHGEEFLEHGRHFHGQNAYGEMINVPLFLSWPGVVPAGIRVSQTVQAIDVLPTILDLARIPAPAEAQGQSLLPLLIGGEKPEDLGWRRRPAFAERLPDGDAAPEFDSQLEAMAVVSDGWKLIRNLTRPEGQPEFELFDHARDPLNLHNVAAEHPDIVEQLSKLLDGWHQAAKAAHIAPEEGTADLSPAEIERLRSLGYI
jgi:arylsulfatase A-like enzyme